MFQSNKCICRASLIHVGTLHYIDLISNTTYTQSDQWCINNYMLYKIQPTGPARRLATTASRVQPKKKISWAVAQIRSSRWTSNRGCGHQTHHTWCSWSWCYDWKWLIIPMSCQPHHTNMLLPPASTTCHLPFAHRWYSSFSCACTRTQSTRLL